jgi:hypothetical protein
MHRCCAFLQRNFFTDILDLCTHGKDSRSVFSLLGNFCKLKEKPIGGSRHEKAIRLLGGLGGHSRSFGLAHRERRNVARDMVQEHRNILLTAAWVHRLGRERRCLRLLGRHQGYHERRVQCSPCACLCSAKRPNKQLQPEMSDFEASERSGAVYLDRESTNSDPIGTSNVGWFLQTDKVSPDEVCATVFARTSVCETKVFIRGQLVVREIATQ